MEAEISLSSLKSLFCFAFKSQTSVTAIQILSYIAFRFSPIPCTRIASDVCDEEYVVCGNPSMTCSKKEMLPVLIICTFLIACKNVILFKEFRTLN